MLIELLIGHLLVGTSHIKDSCHAGRLLFVDAARLRRLDNLRLAILVEAGVAREEVPSGMVHLRLLISTHLGCSCPLIEVDPLASTHQVRLTVLVSQVRSGVPHVLWSFE